MNLKQDKIELKSDDLAGHLTENKNVIPFPNRMRQANNKENNNSLKKRVYAFCVDLYIIVGIKLMMTFTYTSFFKSFFFQLPYQKQQNLLDGLMVVDLSITPIIFFSYFLVSYYSGEGKSVGKMFFKLTVAQNELSKNYLPTFKQAILRTIGYMTCYLSLGTLFFLPFFRKDKRGIPDMFSGTKVYTDHEIYLEFAESETQAEIIEIEFPKKAA